MFRTSRTLSPRVRTRLVVGIASMLILSGCSYGSSWGDAYGSPSPSVTQPVTTKPAPSPTKALLTPAQIGQRRDDAQSTYLSSISEQETLFSQWLQSHGVKESTLDAASRQGQLTAYFCQAEATPQTFDFLLYELGVYRKFDISQDGQKVTTWLDGIDRAALPLTDILRQCNDDPER